MSFFQDTPTKNKTENGDNLRPVETVAKENTNSSILLKNNQVSFFSQN